MNDNADRMLDLAGRVADGAPVNWPEAERNTPGDHERAVVRELKVLAHLAEFHRTPEPGVAGAAAVYPPVSRAPGPPDDDPLAAAELASLEDASEALAGRKLMNSNGPALAAQVGGSGIAPGAIINYDTGLAIFEATHGTAPKYAGQDKVNPGSVILSGEMMFRFMGWNEAADLIVNSLEKTISQKRVTYDFERLMDGATLLKCSEFGEAMVGNMD